MAEIELTGVAHCMESLEREAKYIGRLKLPSNARGREADRERFEQPDWLRIDRATYDSCLDPRDYRLKPSA
jgi:hypothetical protein